MPNIDRTKRQKRDKFVPADAVHLAEYANVQRPTGKSGQPIEPAHKFEVNLEGDSLTKEKCVLPPSFTTRIDPCRYDVFFRYQRKIHNDPASRWPDSAMKRFLCSGLDRSIKKNEKGKIQKLGSYHQCYRLDGKLVAVGVLDLLPHAVSSVYLFYDPDYGHHDWGKISALHEIALAQEAGYGYYYMGYYIHSCTKMRYKAGFRPSQLLDPESHEWNFFDDAYRQKLDKRKYVSPSHDLKDPPPDGADLPAAEPPPAEANNDTTKSRAAKFADDDDLELDEDDSDNDDADIPEGSLFDYNVPGVLTKEEVSALDLSQWKLVVRNSLVDLEVRWEILALLLMANSAAGSKGLGAVATR